MLFEHVIMEDVQNVDGVDKSKRVNAVGAVQCRGVGEMGWEVGSGLWAPFDPILAYGFLLKAPPVVSPGNV